MSIKQRLEYGIYPIASRRHQPKDWGAFQKLPHLWIPEESAIIVISWILTPIIAWIASMLTHWSFFDALILMIVLDIFLIYEVRSS